MTTRLCAAGLAVLLLAGPLRAHPLNITQVLASFDEPGLVDVRIDVDLTPLLPSLEAYRDLAFADPAAQRRGIQAVLPAVTDGLQLRIGDRRLDLVLQDFKLPALSRADFMDPTTDHFTLLHFIAVLPADRRPIRLAVGAGTRIAYPIAFVVQIPSAKISDASWIGDETEESDAIDWAASAPKAGAAR